MRLLHCEAFHLDPPEDHNNQYQDVENVGLYDIRSGRIILKNFTGCHGNLQPQMRTPDSPLNLQQNINHNVSGSSASTGNNCNPDFLSPSQRRLSNVDFSGVSYQSPASRLIKKSNINASNNLTYSLPASRMSVNNQTYTNNFNPRYLDAGIQDSGRRYALPTNYHTQKTQYDPRITETSESAQKYENSQRVTVTIPDLDALQIPLPAWYLKNSSGQDKHHEASGSGVNNLLRQFNDAGKKFMNKIPTDDVRLSGKKALWKHNVYALSPSIGSAHHFLIFHEKAGEVKRL